MTEELECMCTQCGISHYLLAQDVKIREIVEGGHKIVKDMYCEQCGGEMVAIGKAGEEPTYKLK